MVDISRKTSERISCKKNTANKNSTVRITKKKKRLMLVSVYSIFGKKKLRFIKNQEASRLLRKLGIRAPLRNIPFTVDILF